MHTMVVAPIVKNGEISRFGFLAEASSFYPTSSSKMTRHAEEYVPRADAQEAALRQIFYNADTLSSVASDKSPDQGQAINRNFTASQEEAEVKGPGICPVSSAPSHAPSSGTTKALVSSKDIPASNNVSGTASQKHELLQLSALLSPSMTFSGDIEILKNVCAEIKKHLVHVTSHVRKGGKPAKNKKELVTGVDALKNVRGCCQTYYLSLDWQEQSRPIVQNIFGVMDDWLKGMITSLYGQLPSVLRIASATSVISREEYKPPAEVLNTEWRKLKQQGVILDVAQCKFKNTVSQQEFFLLNGAKIPVDAEQKQPISFDYMGICDEGGRKVKSDASLSISFKEQHHHHQQQQQQYYHNHERRSSVGSELYFPPVVDVTSACQVAQEQIKQEYLVEVIKDVKPITRSSREMLQAGYRLLFHGEAYVYMKDWSISNGEGYLVVESPSLSSTEASKNSDISAQDRPITLQAATVVPLMAPPVSQRGYQMICHASAAQSALGQWGPAGYVGVPGVAMPNYTVGHRMQADVNMITGPSSPDMGFYNGSSCYSPNLYPHSASAYYGYSGMSSPAGSPEMQRTEAEPEYYSQSWRSVDFNTNLSYAISYSNMPLESYQRVSSPVGSTHRPQISA